MEVRVAYEHVMHKLRYGQLGKVIGHKGGQVAVLLDKSFVPQVLPCEILVSTAGSPKFQALQTFLRKPMSLKVDMLRVLGVSDPTTEQIEVLLPASMLS